jgi:hypothetical protein
MATHNGFFSHLKPNNHLGINELNDIFSHIELDEDLNYQHLQSKHSLMNIGFKSHAT